jgi:predicted acylesterase/phospholipase RssA
MASAALPIFFPAERVEHEWYGDGGMRLTAPHSPALHLGASRILTISTRSDASRRRPVPTELPAYPPPAQILGTLYNAVFLDVIDQDVVRRTMINDLVQRVPPEQRDGMRVVDILVLRPSVETWDSWPARYEPRLPRVFRFLTRGLGTRNRRAPTSSRSSCPGGLPETRDRVGARRMRNGSTPASPPSSRGGRSPLREATAVAAILHLLQSRAHFFRQVNGRAQLAQMRLGAARAGERDWTRHGERGRGGGARQHGAAGRARDLSRLTHTSINAVICPVGSRASGRRARPGSPSPLPSVAPPARSRAARTPRRCHAPRCRSCGVSSVRI